MSLQCCSFSSSSSVWDYKPSLARSTFVTNVNILSQCFFFINAVLLKTWTYIQTKQPSEKTSELNDIIVHVAWMVHAGKLYYIQTKSVYIHIRKRIFRKSCSTTGSRHGYIETETGIYLTWPLIVITSVTRTVSTQINASLIAWEHWNSWIHYMVCWNVE